MMLDPTSESRLENVMPILADKIRQLADVLAGDEEPIKLVVSAGMRTWVEQNSLYAQGRTHEGKIVTNAQGGESWHNFGCAVDCEPEVKDGSIDWDADHPQWQRMEEAGEELGLTSGATWVRLVDAPHFQLTGPFPEDAPDDEVRDVFTNQGVRALWQMIEDEVQQNG
jgi:peptidoglycan LD-endopeptidase CwlK